MRRLSSLLLLLVGCVGSIDTELPQGELGRSADRRLSIVDRTIGDMASTQCDGCDAGTLPPGVLPASSAPPSTTPPSAPPSVPPPSVPPPSVPPPSVPPPSVPPPVAMCGNATCEGASGESCSACPSDCNTRAVVCGNGECQSGEESWCMTDCGPATWPAAIVSEEEQALVYLNQVRSEGHVCRGTFYPPVGPVTMEEPLRRAARLHSWEMSVGSFLGHVSCNGRTVAERAAAQGSSARAEAAAYNFGTGHSVIDGWLGSPYGHCEALMNGSHTVVGLGMARGGFTPTWTAMFR